MATDDSSLKRVLTLVNLTRRVRSQERARAYATVITTDIFIIEKRNVSEFYPSNTETARARATVALGIRAIPDPGERC